MFQDALFLPDRNWRARAAALPLAALIHAVALTLLVTVPLLRVGDVPRIDVSDIIVVPALPATPLAPPKARTGNPGARLKTRRAVVAAAEAWHLSPVVIPEGISEESFGEGGADFGIPGGVDYGAGEGLPANLLGADLYNIVGKPAEAAVLAVGEVKPPRLVRRIEPSYPDARPGGPHRGRRHPGGDDGHLWARRIGPRPSRPRAPRRRGRRRRPSVGL